MFYDPFAFFALSATTFTSVKHRISGRLPYGWVLRDEPPPWLATFSPAILATFSPGANIADPIISIRRYEKVSDLDALEKLTKTQQSQIGGTSERTVHGVRMRELKFLSGNMLNVTRLCIRGGNGYAIGLWSNSTEEYMTTFDEFLHNLIWIPKSLSEFSATVIGEHIDDRSYPSDDWQERVLEGARKNDDFYALLQMIVDYGNGAIVDPRCAALHTQKCDELAMLICQRGDNIPEIVGSLSHAAPGLLSRVGMRTASSRSRGCFIATVCYGSDEAEEVLLLKRFRDEQLNKTKTGRTLVLLYYWISPTFAAFLRRHPRSVSIVRAVVVEPLLRIVRRVR